MADAIMRYAWPHYTDMADVVIAPSVGLHRVMDGFGVRTPMAVIENGIELQPFISPERPLSKAALNVPADAVLAVYCGRLSAEKNVERLLHIFAQAAKRQDDLHLMLIGKGPLEAELKQLAVQYALTDRVQFIGAVPNAEVANYLAAADLFITASTSEVHPLTVIEALAAGLPVIAFRSPGMDETVDSGETGILVDTADEDFIDALLMLAGDSDRRKDMGIAAQVASLRYDINRTVDRTLALYDDLLTRRPDKTRTDPHGKWRRRAMNWESRWTGLNHLGWGVSSGEKISP